jgi:hypothetical protein
MLIFGLLPETIPYSVSCMPESLFLALLVWSLAAFICFVRSGAAGPLRWSFLLWGFSALTKPVALYFGAVLVVLAAVRLRREPPAWRRAATLAAAVALGIFLLLPWLVRNYIRFGVVGVSSIAGTNLYDWNYRYLLEDMGVPGAGRVLEDRAADITAAMPPGRDNPMLRAQMLGAVAERQIASHPGRYILSVLKRHPRLYVGTGSVATLRLLGDAPGVLAMENALAGRGSWRSVPTRGMILQAVSWLLLLCAYGAAAVGMARLCARGDGLSVAVVLSTLLYFAAVIGPVTSTRYRVLMAPALAVSAACAPARSLRQGATVRPSAMASSERPGRSSACSPPRSSWRFPIAHARRRTQRCCRC